MDTNEEELNRAERRFLEPEDGRKRFVPDRPKPREHPAKLSPAARLLAENNTALVHGVLHRMHIRADYEDMYAEGIKGFTLYGAKVVKPAELVCLKAKIGTEE